VWGGGATHTTGWGTATVVTRATLNTLSADCRSSPRQIQSLVRCHSCDITSRRGGPREYNDSNPRVGEGSVSRDHGRSSV